MTIIWSDDQHKDPFHRASRAMTDSIGELKGRLNLETDTSSILVAWSALSLESRIRDRELFLNTLATVRSRVRTCIYIGLPEAQELSARRLLERITAAENLMNSLGPIQLETQLHFSRLTWYPLWYFGESESGVPNAISGSSFFRELIQKRDKLFLRPTLENAESYTQEAREFRSRIEQSPIATAENVLSNLTILKETENRILALSLLETAS